MLDLRLPQRHLYITAPGLHSTLMCLMWIGPVLYSRFMTLGTFFQLAEFFPRTERINILATAFIWGLMHMLAMFYAPSNNLLDYSFTAIFLMDERRISLVHYTDLSK